MARQPDIVIVVPSMDIGGTERHLAMVVPALQAAGLNILLFVLDGYGELLEPLRETGVTVECPNPAHSLVRRCWKLRQCLSHHRHAIAHFFLPKAYLIGCLCSPRGQTRVLSRRSLNSYFHRRRWARYLERWCHRTLALAMGNSKAIAEQLIAEGIARERVRVIYNGIVAGAETSAEERRLARRELDVDEQTLVIVMVANLIAYKGHADVLEALSKLASPADNDWQLLIIGADRGIGSQLKAQAQQFGLTARIRWCGSVSNLTPYYQAADVAVLASHEEGLSTALLEAMVAGLAVVATEVGGHGEAVVHQTHGLLVGPRNTDALSAALQQLLVDPERRRQLGEAARARVLDAFSPQACVDGYLEAYQALNVKRFSR